MSKRPAKPGVLELLDDKLVGLLARRETFTLQSLIDGVDGLPTDERKARAMVLRFLEERLGAEAMADAKYGKTIAPPNRRLVFFPLEKPHPDAVKPYLPRWVDLLLAPDAASPAPVPKGAPRQSVVAWLPDATPVYRREWSNGVAVMLLGEQPLRLEVQRVQEGVARAELFGQGEPFFCAELTAVQRPPLLLGRVDGMTDGWFGGRGEFMDIDRSLWERTCHVEVLVSPSLLRVVTAVHWFERDVWAPDVE